MAMINHAISVAAWAHRSQFRKGTDIPYISHPYAVGMILARNGFGTPVIAAGILHDTVEDTELTLAQIAERFGPQVARIVDGCTEPDKSLSWETRKAESLARLQSAPFEVKAVLCADKIHNVRTLQEDLRAHGDAVWERFKRGKKLQRWYHVESARILSEYARQSEKGAFFARLQPEVEVLFA